MTQTKEAIEALEAARAHILDAYRIWQADDVSAVPPPKSGAGSVIAKIDAVLSAPIAGQAKADDVFGDWWPSSPGKDGGQEVEAVTVLGYVREAGLRSLAERNHTSIYPSPDEERGYTIPVYTQPASTAQEVEAVKYEARICKGVPADCCDYGVVDLEEGIEVCRVWKEADARLIADLLNGTVWPEPTEDGDDLTECFRHHVRTAIGWQAFGARPGPEMQMYEEGFKAGYRRCQSDNEPEFGEEDAPQPASTALVERLTKALEPFADAADYFSNGLHRPIAEDALPCGPALIVKHLREARAALSASSKEGESRG